MIDVMPCGETQMQRGTAEPIQGWRKALVFIAAIFLSTTVQAIVPSIPAHDHGHQRRESGWDGIGA